MPFLLDTNCWLQIVRVREHAIEVRDLLAGVPAEHISTTDFALHSVALAMGRHKMLVQFPAFLHSSRIGGSVGLIRLQLDDLKKVVAACGTHRLDFDDAYQYVAAELNNLTLVSFDTDFDHTPRGRLTPAAALQRFTDEQRQQTP